MGQKFTFETITQPTIVTVDIGKINDTQPLNTEDEDIPTQIAMIRKKLAVLKGLYVIVRMPTEERLMARFENLSKEDFDKLTALVERYMHEVDAKYRLRENKGRSWKGTGHRINQVATPVSASMLAEIDSRVQGMMETVERGPPVATSQRTVRFSPFPSSTLNIFKTLRKMRSDLYHRYCIVLERQEESFQNNINILPYVNAPEFAIDLQEINAKIEEANQSIREFLESEEWANLLKELADLSYGHQAEYLATKSWTVETCTLVTTEIALETSQVKRHIEDEYRKMFTKIDEEKAKAIEAVHSEFEKGQRSIAEQALESLRSEMKKTVQRIQRRRNPDRMKEDLERLRRKVLSIGLDALEPTVNELKDVVDNPEKAQQLFGTDMAGIEGKIDARIVGLFDLKE